MLIVQWVTRDTLARLEEEVAAIFVTGKHCVALAEKQCATQQHSCLGTDSCPSLHVSTAQPTVGDNDDSSVVLGSSQLPQLQICLPLSGLSYGPQASTEVLRHILKQFC